MRYIWFKIRWWRWFLTAPNMFPAFMYGSAYKLDKDSRRIVSDRIQRQWLAREPRR